MDEAQALEVPVSFTFNGRAYPVGAVTADVEGLFSQWLKDEAWKELYACRAALGEQAFEEQCRGLRGDITAKLYAFRSVNAFKALTSPEGLRFMVLLRFREGQRAAVALGQQPKARAIKPELIEAIYADDGKWRELLDRLAAEEAEPADGEQDPNALPPGPATTTPAPATT